VAALLPALFAIWVHAPVWNGGLLADELLLVGYVTENTADGMRVDWQRVLDDFHGPWAFGYGNYYRPLVTLSLALDHWLAGGAESMLHCTSIALFALCAFSIARLFGELFGARAALFGGLLFAAHPAAHEPICWPCTRADFLVLIAAAWACLHFVRHLRTGRARSLCFAGACAVVALLSKETGVLLAIWLPLLDLGERAPGVPLRTRLLPHLLLAPLWVAYFVFRSFALDVDLTAVGAAPDVDLAMSWGAVQQSKLQALVAPNGDLLPASTPFTLGAVVLLTVLGALVWRVHRRWLGVGTAWIIAALLPVQWLPVAPNLGMSRILLGAQVGTALVAAAVFGRDRTPRGFRWLGVLALTLAVFDLTATNRTIQGRYRVAWQQMHELRRQFDAAGSAATVAAPLVLVAGVPDNGEVPFLSPTMAFALTEPPLARRVHPFVSLGFGQEPRVGHDLLQGEVTPWRQMWQHGATLCYWSSEHTNGNLVLLPGRRRDTGEVALTREQRRFVVAGGSAQPWTIGAIELTCVEPFAGGTLVWHTAHGPAGRRTFAAGQPTAAGFSAVADFDDDRDFLVLGTLAGIRSFEVERAATAAMPVLRVLPPPPPMPLVFLLRDGAFALEHARRHLPVASLPADADAGSRSAVLMNHAFGFRLSLEPGASAELPKAVRALLTEVDRFHAHGRVYYYLECRHRGRRWRSQVDWFQRRHP